MTSGPVGPDRWDRLESLFHASVDLPEEQRDAFLRSACGHDDQLRIEVESLLASDFQESPIIAAIVDDATASLFEDDDRDNPNPMSTSAKMN